MIKYRDLMLIPIYVALSLVHYIVIAHFVLSQDVVYLVRHFIPDDAFYYLEAAWNLVSKGLLSMDGLSPTNGYHPLWMWACVAIAHFSDSKAQFLSQALTFSAIIFYVSGAFFALAAKSVFKTILSFIVASWLYLFLMPHIFISHLNLLETGFVFLVSNVLLYYVVLRVDEWRLVGVSKIDGVVLGVGAGLAFLARTDIVFFAFLLFVVLFVYALSYFGKRSSASATLNWPSLYGPALFGTSFLVVAVPWLAYNQLHFGSPIQVSASILPFINDVRAAAFFEGHGIWHLVGPNLSRFLDQGENFSVGVPIWLALIVILGSVAGCKSRRLLIGVMVPLAGSTVFLIMVHVLVRMPRPWYFTHFSILYAWALLGVFLLFVSSYRAAERRWWSYIVLFSIVGLAHIPALEKYVELFDPGKGGYFQQGVSGNGRYVKIEEMLNKKGIVIGHSDSGIFSFFAPDNVTVVNLDGVMNNSAAEAIQGGRLMQYVLDKGIDYLICRTYICDMPAFMGREFRKHLSNVRIDKNWWSIDAKVIREPPKVAQNLLFTKDVAKKRVDPGVPRDFPFLLGTWCAPNKSNYRVLLQDAGIMFSLAEPQKLNFSFAWKASPGLEKGLYGVEVDGVEIGDFNSAGRAAGVYSTSLPELSAGGHNVRLTEKKLIDKTSSSNKCAAQSMAIDYFEIRRI